MRMGFLKLASVTHQPRGRSDSESSTPGFGLCQQKAAAPVARGIANRPARPLTSQPAGKAPAKIR
jgi:hypothetical protein